MKKLILITLALCGLIFVNNVFADANGTFGIIDMQKIMQSSPKIKAAGDRLKTQFSADQGKIATKQKQLKDLLTKLNRDSSVISDKAKKDLQTKITTARKEYGAMLQSYEQKVMAAQQQAMQKIAASIQNVAEKVAKENNLGMVIVKQAVIYAGNAKDITNQVIKAMK